MKKILVLFSAILLFSQTTAHAIGPIYEEMLLSAHDTKLECKKGLVTFSLVVQSPEVSKRFRQIVIEQTVSKNACQELMVAVQKQLEAVCQVKLVVDQMDIGEGTNSMVSVSYEETLNNIVGVLSNSYVQPNGYSLQEIRSIADGYLRNHWGAEKCDIQQVYQDILGSL